MKNLFGNEATELQDIFLAPLEAVINADIDLSKKVSDFIIHYGFTKPLKDEPDDHIGHIKVVTFSYNYEGVVQQISIPILSLIQLPLLKIKEADFDMRVKLVTTIDENVPDPPPPSLITQEAMPAKMLLPKVKLKAFLSPESKSVPDTMKANMKVNLSMGEGDMPGGIINLLNLMNNSSKVSS